MNWERHVQLAGRSMLIETTSDTEATPARLAVASTFERELARFDAAARAALLRDHSVGVTVRGYIDHHLSELPPASLESLFATAQAATITPEQFLARMILQRVGLHPGEEARTAVFDYTLDKDATKRSTRTLRTISWS